MFDNWQKRDSSFKILSNVLKDLDEGDERVVEILEHIIRKTIILEM